MGTVYLDFDARGPTGDRDYLYILGLANEKGNRSATVIKKDLAYLFFITKHCVFRRMDCRDDTFSHDFYDDRLRAYPFCCG